MLEFKLFKFVALWLEFLLNFVLKFWLKNPLKSPLKFNIIFLSSHLKSSLCALCTRLRLKIPKPHKSPDSRYFP